MFGGNKNNQWNHSDVREKAQLYELTVRPSYMNAFSMTSPKIVTIVNNGDIFYNFVNIFDLSSAHACRTVSVKCDDYVRFGCYGHFVS